MPRHQTSISDGSRDCWSNLREQKRIRARFAIRNRVLNNNNNNNSSNNNNNTLTNTDTSIHNAVNDNNKDIIQSIILRILNGDKSYFSLHTMETNYIIFNTKFPTSYLLLNDDESLLSSSDRYENKGDNQQCVLLGYDKLCSWFGHTGTYNIQKYISSLSTCTFIEYAVWLNKYTIINSFIHGGINPCIRASNSNNYDNDSNNDNNTEHEIILEQLGTEFVLPRFFSGTIPITLATYIITRIVNLRRSMSEWIERNGIKKENNINNNMMMECSLCNAEYHVHQMLCYVDSEYDKNYNNYSWNTDTTTTTCCRNISNCFHKFCEPCMWKDILNNLDYRVSGDVVLCPICSSSTSSNDSNTSTFPLFGSCLDHDIDYEAAKCRQQESLQKYQNLLINSKQLKERTNKRKVIHNSDATCTTWLQAVKLSLGQTQSVRLDKFFTYINKGSYHYILGCLIYGIDTELCNEYGQTALYISIWKNYIHIIPLLLYYGCNPYIYDNSGISCYNLAKQLNYTNIVQLLEKVYTTDKSNNKEFIENSTGSGSEIQKQWWTTLSSTSESTTILTMRPEVTTLIDWSVNHPGAGSFILDYGFSDTLINALTDLWSILPIDTSSKKNSTLCSDRSYYCDCLNLITKPIQSIVQKMALEILCNSTEEENKEEKSIINEKDHDHQIIVFPHMRFLCYSKKGSTLAPHQDLSRIDPITEKRSTHTFLLYLTDCELGGETALLHDLAGEGRHHVLANVKPKRGRLLLFPHHCPHEGLEVIDVPKLLIRGEILIPS